MYAHILYSYYTTVIYKYLHVLCNLTNWFKFDMKNVLIQEKQRLRI